MFDGNGVPPPSKKFETAMPRRSDKSKSVSKPSSHLPSNRQLLPLARGESSLDVIRRRRVEPADGIHVILNGIVESTHGSTQGRELMLSTWEAGDFVGAPYILGDYRHSWSARALGRVEALHLDQGAIRGLIALSPSFAIALIECPGFKGETYSMLAQTLAGRK